MTELEMRYILDRAAGAAEVCVELGFPDSIRRFVCDGYDAAEVRLALEGVPPPAEPAAPVAPAAIARPAASPPAPAPRPSAPTWAEAVAAGEARFAQQAGYG